MLRVLSSAVASSLQMSAPQKPLDQPSQSWWKTRSHLTEIIKVDINTGQVMFYLLYDDDNNTEYNVGNLILVKSVTYVTISIHSLPLVCSSFPQ